MYRVNLYTSHDSRFDQTTEISCELLKDNPLRIIPSLIAWKK